MELGMQAAVVIVFCGFLLGSLCDVIGSVLDATSRGTVQTWMNTQGMGMNHGGLLPACNEREPSAQCAFGDDYVDNRIMKGTTQCQNFD